METTDGTTEHKNGKDKGCSTEGIGMATFKPPLYIDDISMFLTWQNWYLTQQCQMLQSAYFSSVWQQWHVQQQKISAQQTVIPPPSNQNATQNGTNQAGHQPRANIPASPFTNTQRPATGGSVFKVAPYQTRIAAEIIDFVVLLVLKVLIVMLFLGDNYIEQFQYILIIDEQTKIEDLEWILVQAMLFRMIVIVYETLMCWSEINRPLKGATIGKAVMGLKVVSCDVLAELQPDSNTVHVIPGQDIGLARSFSRALLKNVAMSFFFPLLFPVMIFKYNRLIYDAVVGTIVVRSSEEAR